EGLDVSYRKMYDAYCKIFDRCGLKYTVVHADSGAMGGSGSQEFMVYSKIGEALIVHCSKCGYAANDEKAEAVPQIHEDTGETIPMKKVETLDVGTIEELVSFFKTTPDQFAKTLIYSADGNPVAVMLRGDREINETKLKNLLGCGELEMADFDTVTRVTGAAVGFAGPIGLKLKIYADREVVGMKNFIVGANETGYHLVNVNIGRDFEPDAVADLRNVKTGDICPVCGDEILLEPGIEVGHIFKLGTKYSKALSCVYLDESGTEKPMVMGSYGIGLARTMAAVIEQNNDSDGIIWPVSIAPYHAIIVQVNMDSKEQTECAEKLYSQLQSNGIEVLLDDRAERPGVKFKDADLLGIPIRITVGRKAAEGIVEFKKRNEKTVSELAVDEAIKQTVAEIKANINIFTK
ncbi:MAG: proline--tRNA ligase, partial [Eubacteriales bacterium]|nr:proline--tRNA ligase [Eubacteriales bacterium]